MDRFHQFPIKPHKSWFEDALSALSQAKSKQSVGELFYALARAEGFHNLVHVNMRAGTILEVGWVRLPCEFTDEYVARDWAKSDPVLKRARTARSAFSWQEVLDGPGLTAAERTMMDAAAALGVHSGYTIPYHGPDRTSALISISMRERHLGVDPDRIRLLTALALFSHARLAEFDTDHVAPEPATGAASRGSNDGLLSPMEGCANSPFTLTHAHLRELVLIEVGVRRWQMGLTGLGDKIYKSRSKREIADDERWCFHLAPSVLGWSYLRTRNEVEWLRRHIWEHEIDRNEVPDTAGIS